MRTAPVTAEVYPGRPQPPRRATHTHAARARASSPLASAPRGVAQAPAPTGGPRARGLRRGACRPPRPSGTSADRRTAVCEREKLAAPEPCAISDSAGVLTHPIRRPDQLHHLPRSRHQEVLCDQEPVSDQERQNPFQVDREITLQVAGPPTRGHLPAHLQPSA